MSTHQPEPTREPKKARPTSLLLGPGVVLVAVICCAGPALLAAGALGAFGAWLASPWVIGAAIVLLALVVAATVRRRSRSCLR